MLKKLKEVRSKDKGFTIIEVMIVLAIAGLIMLIVFLALPALQRNSRNTQRKNDVAALLAAVSEFIAGQGAGQLPGTPANKSNVITSAKLSHYVLGEGGGTGQVAWASSPSSPPPATAANDRVLLYSNAKCGSGGATVPGSTNQVAAQYQIETAQGPQATCLDS